MIIYIWPLIRRPGHYTVTAADPVRVRIAPSLPAAERIAASWAAAALRRGIAATIDKPPPPAAL